MSSEEGMDGAEVGMVSADFQTAWDAYWIDKSCLARDSAGLVRIIQVKNDLIDR